MVVPLYSALKSSVFYFWFSNITTAYIKHHGSFTNICFPARGAATARLFPVGAIMKAFTALGSENDPMYDVENKETKNRLLLTRVKAKPPTSEYRSETQPGQERRETIDHLYRFQSGNI